MSKLIKNAVNFFGVQQLLRLGADVKQNGGIIKSIKKLYRMDSIKAGRLVGQDKYGNKYYENPHFFFGRNRWVEYAEYKNLEYDATQVPAEWFGWLHYRTDAPPYADIAKLQTKKYKWMMDHSENATGTKDAYFPYSTVNAKFTAWDPKKK
ncbi:hypothetical protein PVAND_013771 [Polypedilum vanderplanki]|uniref:NADH dehydrogenase [ubiquinone] 1 alpha subcomplex subunit 12 n=1 Tax=Polypedilum vanderplanki TaxID=319348 RepID=A0A9J6CQQ4_POLVA|nr:hypothetical protein PVAND_013771 [Polypedilum vanderplanki]